MALLSLKRIAITLTWSLGLLVAVFSLRYFVHSPQAEDAFEVRSAAAFDKIATKRPLPVLAVGSHNRPLVLLHVAGSVLALGIGLFQFLPRLRRAKPSVHRVLGRVYVIAILVGSLAGFPLSYLGFRSLPEAVRNALWPTSVAFATLALVWPWVTGMAFLRVRQRRFEEHRAWMIRSYSLTFAAVTVRLSSIPLLLVTHDGLLAINVATWTWPLNLLVAEWLVGKQHLAEQGQLAIGNKRLAKAEPFAVAKG